MKNPLKKKKKFPFHAKVGGAMSRRRADRYRGGGAVDAKADLDPINPDEPNAPAGGRTTHFQDGGDVLPREPLPPRREVLPREPLSSVRRKPVLGPEDAPSGRKFTPEEVEPFGRKSGGRISMAQRKALPGSDFALPGKGTGPSGKGPGSYPIDTENRARNALARGAQHASPGQLATIKRKVKAKYPDIKVGGE